MLKNNKLGIAIGILVCLQLSLIAQNSTISPYSRLGYGVIADRSFGAGRSMGGIGYGLRSNKQINPMNPASYSSMDSLTFLFDVGATLQYTLLNDGTNSHKNFNGNLMYLAMQFPLSHSIAMSVGLLPYSHTGYNFKTINNDDDVSHEDRFTGKGGLNEVYVGLSIDIWKKRLALGANVGYLFGIIEHRSSVSYATSNASNLYTLKKMNLRNFKYELGVQYTQPLSKTERTTFGFTFSPKIKLSSVANNIVASDEYFYSRLESDTIYNQKYDIPTSYGFGVSYEKDYKMIVAADVSWQEWSKTRFMDEHNTFKNRLKFAVGGEYLPNNFTQGYLSRVRYRIGFNYSNSYLRVNNSGYKEYGISLGAGFPMLDTRSFMDARSYINASFEYVKVEPEVKSLISEQYFRFTLSFTFNEYWFFKRRID